MGDPKRSIPGGESHHRGGQETMYSEVDEVVDAIVARAAAQEGATHYWQLGQDGVNVYRPARGQYLLSGFYAVKTLTRLQDWRENPYVISGDGTLPKLAVAIASLRPW